MRQIILPILFSFLVFVLNSKGSQAADILNMNSAEAQQKVLVQVGNQSIRLKDLVDFAKKSATFFPYLQIPGGPEKILDEMIWYKLFVLEGHDLDIPEPTEEEGGEEVLYVLRVKKRLLPEFSPLTEDEVCLFYKEHPEEFSTPLMLRVSQIRVFIKNGNEAQARKRVEAALKALGSGKKAFDQIAREYSEDTFSKERGGDLGFIPMEKIDPPELEQTLRALPVGRISDVVRVGQALAIYKITDRRDPVLDPYDQVSGPAREKAEYYRTKKALDILRKEMEAKWGVTYLDPEFRLKGR
jgi:hypothetical protein